MTAPTPTAGSAGDQGEAEFVIRKSGWFYRPEAAGYTKNVSEAGRWPEAEARRHESKADGIVAIPLHEAFQKFSSAEDLIRQETAAIRTRLAASEARAQAAEARLRTLETLIEPMREVSEAADIGPWAYRPYELDDWGWVRGPALAAKPAGQLVCIAKGNDDEYEQIAARSEWRDPRNILANARLIVAAVNILRDIIATLPTTDKDASHG